MQTSYDYNLAVGAPGMLADAGPKQVNTRANPVDVIPFGVAVCRGVDPAKDVKLPTTAAEAAASVGIALKTNVLENVAGATEGSYPIKSPVNVLRKGRAWVKVLEAVTAGDKVYVRYATGIVDNTDTQKGGFGKAGDGTAQVATLTPSAANATVYTVEVNGRTYSIVSSGSATATNINDQFRTAMAADPFVNATGTATLILTAKTPGTAFDVSASANIAVVATTPNAAASALWPNSEYVTSAVANGLAVVEINLP